MKFSKNFSKNYSKNYNKNRNKNRASNLLEVGHTVKRDSYKKFLEEVARKELN